jgi:YesN/AraC family two-component response regulator
VTNEKIDTIAVLCGYTNPNYLKNLFKKHFGLSMRDFRQRVKGVI